MRFKLGRGIGFGHGSAPKSIATKTIELLGSDLTGGVYFDADVDLINSLSDVDSWVSVVGGVVAHNPAYYGETTPITPQVGALASGNKAVDFTVGNAALILDCSAAIFDGVSSTLDWTIIVQLEVYGGGYLLSAAHKTVTTQYVGRYFSNADVLNQKDDSGVGGNIIASAAGITYGVEYVQGLSKDAANHDFFQNGTPYGLNPFVASLGQTTLERLTFGVMFRGAATYSSWGNFKLRRGIFTPADVSDAKQTALSSLWKGA